MRLISRKTCERDRRGRKMKIIKYNYLIKTRPKRRISQPSPASSSHFTLGHEVHALSSAPNKNGHKMKVKDENELPLLPLALAPALTRARKVRASNLPSNMSSIPPK
jgi:hypothetical protein